jgi:hypothetical protein
LHGVKESYAFGAQNTFGAMSGLRIWRMLRQAADGNEDGAHYHEPRNVEQSKVEAEGEASAKGGPRWVSSHDGILTYAGFIMEALWLYDVPKNVGWVVEQERKEKRKLVGRRDPGTGGIGAANLEDGDGDGEEVELEVPKVVEVMDAACFVLA